MVFRPLGVPENDQKQKNRRRKQSLLSVASDISKTLEVNKKCCGSINVELVKNPLFIRLCISNLLSCLGYSVPYIFLTDLSISLGFDSSSSAFLISIIGISNTIARVFFGFISDYKCVNMTLLYNTNLVVCGLVSLGVTVYTMYPLLAVYAVIFGICSGE